MLQLIAPALLASTPMTADYLCWMSDGQQVINLSYMCQSAAVSSPANISSTSQEITSPRGLLPYAGTVCADFATQEEAQYHYQLGTAPKSLDRDDDGIACEDLAVAENRTGGSRVGTYRSTLYEGVEIALYDVGRRNIGGDFYLEVTAPGLGIFTTRSFANKSDAIAYMRTYYGYTQGL